MKRKQFDESAYNDLPEVSTEPGPENEPVPEPRSFVERAIAGQYEVQTVRASYRREGLAIRIELVVTSASERRIAAIKSKLDGLLWCDVTFGVQPRTYQHTPMYVTSNQKVHKLVTTVSYDNREETVTVEEWGE